MMVQNSEGVSVCLEKGMEVGVVRHIAKYFDVEGYNGSVDGVECVKVGSCMEDVKYYNGCVEDYNDCVEGDNGCVDGCTSVVEEECKDGNMGESKDSVCGCVS